MLRKVIGAVAVCGLVVLGTAAPAAARGSDTLVVARVDGTPISVARFNTSYVQHLIQTGRNDTPKERYLHLDNLIDDLLLAGEARRRGLEDAGYRAFVDREIKKAVGGRFVGVAFVDSLPDLTEAEVRDAFRKSQEKVVVRHLFYRNPADAAAAYARLQAGEDFLMLANECFGTAAFDSSAGFLGVAGYWELDDAFAEVAFALPVGRFSEPVRTRYGWHVIRVEDRLVNPILTESAYQYRREGILGQARQRRLRLEGDRFVRGLMERLGVVVDRAGMAALQAAVGRIAGGAGEDAALPQVVLDREEVAAIEADLTPETVLATYTLDGAPHTFTARDYVAWLDELPAGEVRHRTAASVGRALRNEVLAMKGLAMGLDRDAWVREEVAFHAAAYLADSLRAYLRVFEPATPTEEELREGFERLGYRRLEAATADFWYIRFATFAEAEAARDSVEAGLTRPEAYPAFTHVAGDLRDGLGELGAHLRRAPLRTPVVIGTGDGAWYVARVEDRTVTYTTFEEVRDAIHARLSAYLPEVRLSRDLRQTAQIEVDEALFEQMMQLDGSV